MKPCLSGLCAAFLFAIAPSASAALISPLSATTTMGSGFATDLADTISGVGLSSMSLSANHDATVPGNSWVSDLGNLTGDITFDLGGVFSIQGFSFWNQNNGGPGAAGSTGIQNLVISSSLDNITFTPVIGAPTSFAQNPSLVSTSQQFAFGAIDASHVRFSVASNYGDQDQTGFAEVQFNRAATSVPDSGSTLALLGALLLGYAAVRHGKLSIS